MRMHSIVALFTVPHIPPEMSGQVAVVSLAVAVLLSSGYRTPIMNHEGFQVLALTLGSICGVAVVAGILICIPDLISASDRSRHRGRGRARHRTQRGNKNNSNRPQPPSSKERLNQNDYPSSSLPTKSISSHSAMTNSRKKSPSMPPSTTTSRNSKGANMNPTSTPDLVPVSKEKIQRKPILRRYSSPPSLPLQESTSQLSLNTIAERKLENLMDYEDYWWRELDSRTQYCALILGYTPSTWDDDFELEDLDCEEWDWDEMTKEQKAAAIHFGYDEESWTDN